MLFFKKSIYNKLSDDNVRVINGYSSGLIDFNGTPHKEFYTFYKKMRERTWFPEQVNVGKDKINFTTLTRQEQRTYELLLSQLIASDSMQANTLMDNINSYITSPVVNACVIEQASQECVHSNSYAIMAEEIVPSVTRDKIYTNHLNDKELDKVNSTIRDLYTTGHEDTETVMLKNIGVSQVLEYILFPCSFIFFLERDDKMPGSAEMIKEIYKDEELSHVPMFRAMYLKILEETYKKPSELEMISRLVFKHISTAMSVVKEWLLYATKDTLNKDDLITLIHFRFQQIAKHLGIEEPTSKILQDKIELKDVRYNSILRLALKGGDFNSKTNFFEANPTEYSRGKIKQDY